MGVSYVRFVHGADHHTPTSAAIRPNTFLRFKISTSLALCKQAGTFSHAGVLFAFQHVVTPYPEFEPSFSTSEAPACGEHGQPRR